MQARPHLNPALYILMRLSDIPHANLSLRHDQPIVPRHIGIARILRRRHTPPIRMRMIVADQLRPPLPAAPCARR